MRTGDVMHEKDAKDVAQKDAKDPWYPSVLPGRPLSQLRGSTENTAFVGQQKLGEEMGKDLPKFK